MSPEKALELVGKYSRLKRAINACKPRIAAELEKCPGLKGKRHEVDADGWPTRGARNDQDTHLSVWYSKDYGEDGEFGFDRFTVGENDEEEECSHCFAAHKIVQERKELRRQHANVCRHMTGHGTPPSSRARPRVSGDEA